MADDKTTRSEKNEIFTGPSGAQPGMPTRNVMKDDFGFEIPVETVPLPSRGITYPSDNQLSGTESVEFRAMTAREEDILTSKALIKKLEALEDITYEYTNSISEGMLDDKKLSSDSLLFDMGQIYYFDFNQIDSAISRHSELISKFPNSKFSPKSAFILSILHCRLFATLSSLSAFLSLALELPVSS